MAWTTGTWVNAQIPTEATLNALIRDNLNMLALHNHGSSTGSGAGSAALGNLITVTMIDAAAPSAPGGSLTTIYSSATAFGVIAGGGTPRPFSTSGHEHAIATAQGLLTTGGTATGGTLLTGTFYAFSALATGGATATLLAKAITIGGTGSRAVAVSGAAIVWIPASGGADIFSMYLDRDGTNLVTLTAQPGVGSVVYSFVASTVELNRASGSATYLVRFGNVGTAGTVYFVGRALTVSELKQS